MNNVASGKQVVFGTLRRVAGDAGMASRKVRQGAKGERRRQNGLTQRRRGAEGGERKAGARYNTQSGAALECLAQRRKGAKGEEEERQRDGVPGGNAAAGSDGMARGQTRKRDENFPGLRPLLLPAFCLLSFPLRLCVFARGIPASLRSACCNEPLPFSSPSSASLRLCVRPFCLLLFPFAPWRTLREAIQTSMPGRSRPVSFRASG